MVLTPIILYACTLLGIIIINFKEDINRSFPELRLPGFDSIQFNIFIVSKIADPRARIIMTKNLTR